MKGIDISKWNKDVDFERVKKSGVEFVILRAGYGKGVIDPYFEKNYKAAKAAKLKVGAYWYSYADEEKDAKEEAEACIKALKGKQLEMPVFYDVEEAKQLNRGTYHVSKLIKAFMSTLEKKKFFAGLYMSKFFLETKTDADVRKNYFIWVAQYNKECTYNGHWEMWQCSAKGKIDGVNGNVDVDWCPKDISETIIKKGFNGFKAKGE